MSENKTYGVPQVATVIITVNRRRSMQHWSSRFTVELQYLVVTLPQGQSQQQPAYNMQHAMYIETTTIC